VVGGRPVGCDGAEGLAVQRESFVPSLGSE
jgi:hypothetical protein